MGGKTPKVPPVIERDPVEDERKALEAATRKSNAELADRRRRRHGSSLLTMGAAGTTAAPSNTLLAQTYGKPTLGGG